MLETTFTLLKLLAAVGGIFYVIQVWRQAQAKHPVFSYDQHSLPNETNWRWRKPDVELGMQLRDDPQKSTLHLPVHYLGFEKVCIVIGALGALFVLYLYGLFVVRHDGIGNYLGGLVFVFLSLALLHVGSRVSTLTLFQDHLVVVVQYAFVLKHTYVYQHSVHLDFSGKPESVFEMTVDHKEPDFKLYIKRHKRWLFSGKRRFIVSANQSQGSWLVAGLHYWRDHAGIAKQA
ncbi:MAG: hypothetical protein RL748_4187 [Pseudomonadota bacterium]